MAFTESYSGSMAIMPNLETRAIGVYKPKNADALVLSAWAQGYMVGSIIVMIAITVSNMRRRVLLHKLILLELLLGIWHGTYIFPNPPVYSWYLSATALLLNVSWSLHNVVAWLKNKPFLGRRASLIYIGTVILAQPYWVLEIYADFAYFANVNKIFVHTRPFEALFRDPWWVFTTCSLFYNIKTRYEFGFFELIRISPRFGILLLAMLLSLTFTIFDILAVTDVLKHGLPAGIDPFWELAFVFKLLTDSVILDDFKTALDRLHKFKLSRLSRLSADEEITAGGVVPPSSSSEIRTRGPSFASLNLISNQNAAPMGQQQKKKQRDEEEASAESGVDDGKDGSNLFRSQSMV